MVESKRIKVYLNGKPVHIFRGMKVKHILNQSTLKEIGKGDKIVTDEDGHERGLEGSLAEGEKLLVKRFKKT
jgi:hypothetical protein